MTATERVLSRVLERQVLRGSLQLTFSDGTTRIFGAPTPGFPDVALRFKDERVARDILMDVRLGFAEAYIDGRVSIERGEVMHVVELLRMNNRWEDGRDLAAPSITRKLRRRIEFLRYSFNKPSESRRNVAHHYDIGNALYRLMLDPEHMQYSC